ncbi:MAG: hypothetical protein HN929_01245 [Chloroflexi bacterium]|jgi:hypothetical protein|nr:hypothetical protein [Chloroflexota bacterium]MBT7080087.1 hypothetical protein [Chloroflexota bacterium]MBT7290477.1 hypothetical protein [Chloroflexota bacterium]
MAFISAFISLTPDADPAKHTSVLETPMHTMYSVLVKDLSQTIDVCKKLVADKGVQSISLCPGFRNQGVGQIADAVGSQVAVTVARGDSPGSKLTSEILRKEGWIK